jgi:unsaturated rhamnogalacturonyl hydrolase
MRWWLVSVTLAASCASPPPDWCTDKAPDEACFRAKRPVEDPRLVRAVEVAEAYMSRHPATGLEWGWEEGVLVTALSELHRVTGDEALEQYLRDYLDHHTEAGVRFEVSDDCPPAAVAAYLGGYDELLAAMNRYLDHEALRTPEGLLNHNGVLELIPPSAWLDSLFMVGMPLMRQAEFQGRDDRLTLLSEQLAGFIDVLSDDSGFFIHADEHWINAQDAGVFWARGNAWVTAAMGEYLRLKRNRGERDERVEQALQKQVEALASQQDASGRWWTLLSHPGEVYQETSATALFAFGMARAWRYGALDDSVLPVVHRAIDGVLEKIEARAGGPVVVDVSGPTMAGTRAVYSEVPLREDLSFGVGAVILALIETSGLPK